MGTQTLLDVAGIGRERLHLGWVSASEGQRFAEMVTEFTELVMGLGPFHPQAHQIPLEATLRTLQTETVRWLMGMQRELTEKGNVYGDRLGPEAYQGLLDKTLTTEYRKSLIFLTLREGPLSVREIEARTHIAVQDISSLLTDLEAGGEVELHGYEGRTPRFAGIFAQP